MKCFCRHRQGCLPADEGRSGRFFVFETRPVDLHTEMHVESLYVFGAKLFIGTFSNGVFVLDGPDGRIHPLNERIPHVPIRSFARTKDNLLLVGADGAGVFAWMSLLENF